MFIYIYMCVCVSVCLCVPVCVPACLCLCAIQGTVINIFIQVLLFAHSNIGLFILKWFHSTEKILMIRSIKNENTQPYFS